MSIDRRQVVVDSVVLSGVVLAGIVGFVLVADPPDVERSHDGRPMYLAAPAGHIEMPYADGAADGWVVYAVCEDAAVPWPVADGANRTAALAAMAALPPPTVQCPPLPAES